MLAKKNRIATEYFPEVTRGKTLQNEAFRVVIKKDPILTEARCAVIVPNKIAKTAVLRNKIRRQVYQALGNLIPSLPVAFISVFPKRTDFKGFDMVSDLKALICSKK